MAVQGDPLRRMMAGFDSNLQVLEDAARHATLSLPTLWMSWPGELGEVGRIGPRRPYPVAEGIVQNVTILPGLPSKLAEPIPISERRGTRMGEKSASLGALPHPSGPHFPAAPTLAPHEVVGTSRSISTMAMFLILLPVLILISWLRLFRPGDNALQGSPIMYFPMPVLARVRMHLVPAGLAIVIAMAMAAKGLLPWWLVAAPVISAILLIAIPIRYTLTSQGIRLGWSSFRRWTEFAGVQRTRGGACLVGGHKARDMRIWLSRSRGDDEFLQYLRITVRDAYKGTATVVPYPAERRAAPEPDFMTGDGIAAYTAER